MTDASLADRAALVAVGDADRRLALSALLEEIGFGGIRHAASSEEAFRVLGLSPVDLVLAEADDGRVDGYTLTRRVRHDTITPNPFVPIVLMLDSAERPAVLRARDVGATLLLLKPVTGASLAQRLPRALNDPRRFVRSRHYVGPDRRVGRTAFSGTERRREDWHIAGPERRHDEFRYAGPERRREE